jgi:hypothetical protein
MTVPVSEPPGCAGIVTVNVPCGADQSIAPPAVCVGPGLVTVRENVRCAGANDKRRQRRSADGRYPLMKSTRSPMGGWLARNSL